MKQFRDTQYIVYEDGRIHNTITNRWLKTTKRLLKRNKTERILVNLTINGKFSNFFLHRILAEVFIPNPNNLPHVNHIDGNPLNNDLSNLEWVTASDNNKHAINTGLRPTKLNKALADEIRAKYAISGTQKDLAKEYNVGKTIINKIVNNISWI